jgi:hypothetical protein
VREVLIGGFLGVAGVLLGQLLAQRASRLAADNESVLRREELWAELVLPAVSQRSSGLIRLFDILQQTVDSGSIEIRQYDEIRSLLVFLPDSVLARTVRAYRSLVAETMTPEISAEIKGIQTEIRMQLGFNRIERKIAEVKE